MKRIISILFALYLFVFLAAGVSAAQEQYIFDEANCLSSSEREQLEAMAADITAEYPINIYVVTVDNYRNLGYYNIEEAAKWYYNSHNLGYGSDRDGMLLLLSMNDRDYWMLVKGDYAAINLTDYGRIQLSEQFMDDFHEDRWFDGFKDYYKTTKDYLYEAKTNRPVDKYPMDTKKKLSLSALISLLFGYPASAFTCAGMKAKMRSVKPQAAANRYLNANSIDFSDRSEVFTHTTQVRTRIPRQDRDDGSGGHIVSGGFGGAGTHVDSGGFGGHGGKF